mmetsp:Transcript_23195/g.50919  ORF Transcript_23195/g.50919 Transcript_23195/m.50919 type:complete len:211 (+) Transcript_23195:524-1156(+)
MGGCCLLRPRIGEVQALQLPPERVPLEASASAVLPQPVGQMNAQSQEQMSLLHWQKCCFLLVLLLMHSCCWEWMQLTRSAWLFLPAASTQLRCKVRPSLPELSQEEWIVWKQTPNAASRQKGVLTEELQLQLQLQTWQCRQSFAAFVMQGLLLGYPEGSSNQSPNRNADPGLFQLTKIGEHHSLGHSWVLSSWRMWPPCTEEPRRISLSV